MKSLWRRIRELPRGLRRTLVMGGVVLGLLLSLPAVEVVHYFSTNAYCTSCHSMRFADESFAMSLHGGNNDQGFVADCASCHLPNSNIVHELWVKGVSGVRDVFKEYVVGVDVPDHESLHARRTEFAYESGCLGCHRMIEERATGPVTADSPVSDQVHRLAFEHRAQEKTFHCANCHFEEAHAGLRETMRAVSRERFIAEARR